jgi:hypothetical protein
MFDDEYQISEITGLSLSERRSSAIRLPASVVCHPTGIRSTGLIVMPDEDSAAARLMSAKS